MNRREQIKLTAAERDEFLEQQRVVICATNGVRGWPHLMPLWYVVRDGRIWRALRLDAVVILSGGGLYGPEQENAMTA